MTAEEGELSLIRRRPSLLVGAAGVMNGMLSIDYNKKHIRVQQYAILSPHSPG
jgi:hypothetical protein